LLVRILDTLANKFTNLNHTLLEIRKQLRRKKLEAAGCELPSELDEFDFEQMRPIQTPSGPSATDAAHDPTNGT
jgi:hypothetical protein